MLKKSLLKLTQLLRNNELKCCCFKEKKFHIILRVHQDFYIDSSSQLSKFFLRVSKNTLIEYQDYLEILTIILIFSKIICKILIVMI